MGMRLASLPRVLALFALVGGLSGCGDALEDAFSCWLICPLESGPLEVKVETAEGLDPSLVRLGVFVAYPDHDTDTEEPGLDVLVSRGGKAKLDPYFSSARAFAFTPVLTDTLDGGHLQAEFPEARLDDDYRIIVWYDADGDGKLDLDLDGTSEFARAPARRFGDDSFDSYVFSLTPYDEASDGSEDPSTPVPGSQWLLSADYCDDADDECTYGEHPVHPEQLDGWSVVIEGPTM